MKKFLFKNAIFHSGVNENDEFSYMTVDNGVITGTYRERPAGKFEEVDLGGKHVFPCLIDSHMHITLTLLSLATGLNVCEITENGVKPDCLSDVGAKIRAFAAGKGKRETVACYNYIAPSIAENRLPTRFELDDWCGGRPAVVYNIDCHSSSVSTPMLLRLGIDPAGHNGILTGEEHEFNQGRLNDAVYGGLNDSKLKKAMKALESKCFGYGISCVGALEGSGDSKKDPMTKKVAVLAKKSTLDVKLYLQYTDIERVKKYGKYQDRPRIGGCGDWELDGSVGSHSAAFPEPYIDTNTRGKCYRSDEFVDRLVSEADGLGFQISAHAIGPDAIKQLLHAYEKNASGTLHRIEHCEFFDDECFGVLKSGKYAVVMQPGYAWADKRFFHTYEKHLNRDIRGALALKKLYDAGVILCGSSDSPVQEINPYVQLQGMVDFYNENESLTNFEAFTCYTKNAAKALLCGDTRGTLEPGKAADFFTADENFFSLERSSVINFRPTGTYIKGIWRH